MVIDGIGDTWREDDCISIKNQSIVVFKTVMPVQLIQFNNIVIDGTITYNFEFFNLQIRVIKVFIY